MGCITRRSFFSYWSAPFSVALGLAGGQRAGLDEVERVKKARRELQEHRPAFLAEEDLKDLYNATVSSRGLAYGLFVFGLSNGLASLSTGREGRNKVRREGRREFLQAFTAASVIAPLTDPFILDPDKTAQAIHGKPRNDESLRKQVQRHTTVERIRRDNLLTNTAATTAAVIGGKALVTDIVNSNRKEKINKALKKEDQVTAPVEINEKSEHFKSAK